MPRFILLAFSTAIEPLRIANPLTHPPLYSRSLLSMDGGPVESSAGIRVEVDLGLAALGRDATVVVCSGTDASQTADRRLDLPGRSGEQQLRNQVMFYGKREQTDAGVST